MFTTVQTTGGPRGYPPETTLFLQAQAGCAQSLNWLMDRHSRLVVAVVRRQVLGDLPFADALQAGRIGLWRAILGFDPARGLAFSTYAWTCIKHHVWRAVKQHAKDLALHQEKLPEMVAPDPAAVYEQAVVHRTLLQLVERLPDRLGYVVVTRYGLNGHPPLLYRQIGAALGLCDERARQLHTEALVWLRHPAHSYTLRCLLERHSPADYEWAESQARRWLHQRGGHHVR